jgi:hypothetical protein
MLPVCTRMEQWSPATVFRRTGLVLTGLTSCAPCIEGVAAALAPLPGGWPAAVRNIERGSAGQGGSKQASSGLGLEFIDSWTPTCLLFCCAVPCCAVTCRAVLCRAVVCITVMCCAVPCGALAARCAVLCQAMPYGAWRAVNCCAVQCHAVLSVLCCACCAVCRSGSRPAQPAVPWRGRRAGAPTCWR